MAIKKPAGRRKLNEQQRLAILSRHPELLRIPPWEGLPWSQVKHYVIVMHLHGFYRQEAVVGRHSGQLLLFWTYSDLDDRCVYTRAGDGIPDYCFRCLDEWLLTKL